MSVTHKAMYHRKRKEVERPLLLTTHEAVMILAMIGDALQALKECDQWKYSPSLKRLRRKVWKI